jgi:hypothetical protein
MVARLSIQKERCQHPCLAYGVEDRSDLIALSHGHIARTFEFAEDV